MPLVSDPQRREELGYYYCTGWLEKLAISNPFRFPTFPILNDVIVVL
jgi:hypothetical protein